MLAVAYGTSPEYIKVKPILDALDGRVPCRAISTGQHTDLLTDSVEGVQIKITDGENRLNSIIASILSKENEHALDGVKHLVVQGDTTSALAMAIAAFNKGIKIYHLEAGLRTHDKLNPYPEEANRQLISRLADVHFCPTIIDAQNLDKEGIKDGIYVTGNTVLDGLSDEGTEYGDTVLITLHRRENHARMAEWFTELDAVARIHSDLTFCLPIHPNPNVKKHESLLTSVKVVDPLNREEFLEVLKKSRFVITDSGGVQEEASFFKKKCIVCRKGTERIAGLGTFSILCDKPSALLPLVLFYKNDFELEGECPYGDGHATERVIQVLYASM